jgi:hypothetical protein
VSRVARATPHSPLLLTIILTLILTLILILALGDQVLEPYSQIFKQQSDDSAPDGSDLGAWIQTMLQKMQGSIEQHIISSLRNRPEK